MTAGRGNYQPHSITHINLVDWLTCCDTYFTTADKWGKWTTNNTISCSWETESTESSREPR